MDVLSHSLFGRLLGRFDADRVLGRGSRAAFVLGALAPDLDLIVTAAGWDRYLHLHEVGTHTVAASPLVAMLVAATVRLCVKGSRVWRLWIAAWVSVLAGHLVFDLVSGSDMRLFVPFDNVRLSPHWLAMGDLLVIGILAAATAVSFWRPRAAAAGSVIALSALLAVKAHSQRRAVESFRAPVAGDPARVPAGLPEAVNGSLFEWTLFERSGGALRVWRVDARTGAREVRFERHLDPEAQAIAEANLHVPAIATFLELAHVPFPRLEATDGRRWLLWSDLRYCRAARCDLSFGAELDASSHAIRQVIRIGPFEQSRPMPPPGRLP